MMDHSYSSITGAFQKENCHPDMHHCLIFLFSSVLPLAQNKKNSFQAVNLCSVKSSVHKWTSSVYRFNMNTTYAVKGGIKCWAGRSTIFCLINFWQATVTWPLLSSMHFWMWCLKCLFSRHWLKRNQEYNDCESWDLHQCQSAGLPTLIKNWSQCVCYAHQWSLLYKWHRAMWSIYVKLLSVIEVSGR